MSIGAYQVRSSPFHSYRWLTSGTGVFGFCIILLTMHRVYPVEIPEGITFEYLVKKAGIEYPDINSDEFPLNESQYGISYLVIREMPEGSCWKDVLREMSSEELLPAQIGHLLAFAAKYPDVLREKRLLFAVGQVHSWTDQGGRKQSSIPYLDFSGDEILLRDSSDGPWSNHWFLAVLP